MSGFDDLGVFYSDSFGGDPAADEGKARKSQLQRRFKEFLRQYRVGTDRTGFTFKYRCGPGGGAAPTEPARRAFGRTDGRSGSGGETGERGRSPSGSKELGPAVLHPTAHPVADSFACFIPEVTV